MTTLTPYAQGKSLQVICNGEMVIDVIPSANVCDQGDWEKWDADFISVQIDSVKDTASDGFRKLNCEFDQRIFLTIRKSKGSGLVTDRKRDF